jgi:hypothetical protein
VEVDQTHHVAFSSFSFLAATKTNVKRKKITFSVEFYMQINMLPATGRNSWLQPSAAAPMGESLIRGPGYGITYVIHSIECLQANF